MKRFPGTVTGAAMLLLAGCATLPAGPTVAVMPGANKNFDAFAQDQSVCTGYALQQVGGQAQVANNQAVGGAVLGTALGAGLGAAAGGGTGAAIGAASGAVAGTALGAGYSGGSSYEIQQRYNIAYAQCMSSKGNQVQWGPGGYRRGYYPPPPPGYYPPPPPGYYPPPPPGSYPPPPPPPAQ